MSVDDWARREAEFMRPAGVVPQGAEQVGPYGDRRYAAGVRHAFDALLSDKAVEAAAQGIASALERHRPPLNGKHVDKGTYQFRCSCGQWSVEMLNDASYFGGLTPTTTDSMWARTKRAHKTHLIEESGRAALQAAVDAVTKGGAE